MKKLNSKFIILFITIFSANFCFAQQQDSIAEKDQVLAEIKNTEPRAAAPELQAKVKAAADKITNPKTADDFFLKAYAAQMDERYDTAIEYFRKVIKLGSDNAVTYYYMGNSYYGKLNPDKAMDYYKKAIALKPDYAEVYNMMGNAYDQGRQNYDKAIECYKNAIKFKPDYAGAYSDMGISYYRKHDYDKTIECLEKAIEIKPDFATAYYNMGVAYRDKKDYDKANECYKKAAQLGY